MKILNSASRIVFILLTATACFGLFKGKISENNFMLLATSAFAFYFSKPSTPPNSDSGLVK